MGKKRERVFEFIGNYIRESGVSPTYEEIMTGVGLRSKAPVAHHLQALEEADLISILPNTSRGIRLTDKGKASLPFEPFPKEVQVRLPLGRIAAGKPIQFPEHILIDHYTYENSCLVSIPHSLVKEKDHMYALQVIGDSMIDAAIYDGDIVVMSCKEADLFIARRYIFAIWLIDREETTLKYIYQEKDGRIRLQPANKKFPVIYTYPENINIQGWVVKSFTPIN